MINPCYLLLLIGLKKQNFLMKFFVLTSIKKSDDVIEEYCKKNNKIFRGSLDNVLSRFISFGKRFNAFGVVRICGDSPLIDYDFSK